MTSSERLLEAVTLARAGRKFEARQMLLALTDEDPQNELAWIWLTGLVDSLEDKIIACENVLSINPANQKVRAYLSDLKARQAELQREEDAAIQPALLWEPPVSRTFERPPVIPPPNPQDLLERARLFEQEGHFQEAVAALSHLATLTHDSREFDRIYKDIARLEYLQREKIAYVAPSASITRMAFGWPLLYFFLVLVQVGGRFFNYPAWYLWLGIPFVALGSYLMALSEVNARHPIWKTLFAGQKSSGSAFARFMVGGTGSLLVLIPHLLLVLDAALRMRDFQIPPYPY